MNSQLLRYLSLPYRVEIYPDEGGHGFTASVPDLPGCVTSADSIEEVVSSIQEAKEVWIQVALEEGDEIPEPSPLTLETFSGKFLIRAPKSLHRRLVKRAQLEGVSLNQLVVTLLAESMGESGARQAFDVRLGLINDALDSLAPVWAYSPPGLPAGHAFQWKHLVDLGHPEDASSITLVHAGTR
jgi:antitoxin HicB